MATTRKRGVKLVSPPGITVPPTTVPPIDPDGGPEDDTDFARLPITAGEQDNLSYLMAELAGTDTAMVKVYRVTRNKPVAYVCTCSPDTFSLDDLRDEYGGGLYRVYVHVDGKLMKNIPVAIEAKPKAASTEEPYAVGALRDELQKQGKLLEALALRATQPPAPPSLGALLGGASLPEVIAAFGTLLTVIRPPAPPMPAPAPAPADGATAIDMLMKGIQLARELREDAGGGGESTLLDVVRDMVKSPFIAQAMEASAQAAPQHAPATPRLQRPRPTAGGPMTSSARQPSPELADRPPAPVPGGAPVPAPDASEVVDPSQQPLPLAPQMADLVKHYMAALTAQAAADSDPELYAGLIVDQLDNDTLNALLDREPDAVSALIADYPPAAPYREWFETVVAYIESALTTDEDSGELESVGGEYSGNGDASGSGETGTTG